MTRSSTLLSSLRDRVAGSVFAVVAAVVLPFGIGTGGVGSGVGVAFGIVGGAASLVLAPTAAVAAEGEGEGDAVAAKPGAAAGVGAKPDCPPPLVVSNDEIRRLAGAPQPDRGLLWRVSRDDREGYLYGTIHVGRLEWAFPGPTVREALVGSRRLAVELDIADPRVLAELGTGLRSRFDEAGGIAAVPEPLRARLTRLFAAACLPVALLDQQPPALAAVTLIATSVRDADLHPELGVDGALIGFMRALGRPVESLETVAEQVAIFEATPAEVETTLDDIEGGTARRDTLDLADAWQASDSALIGRYFDQCGCADDDRLFGARNATLATRIDDALGRDGPVFVAIGALHLIGDGSVIERLRGRGYRVEPLLPVATAAPSSTRTPASTSARTPAPGQAPVPTR